MVVGGDGRIRTLVAQAAVTGEAGGTPVTLRWDASFDDLDRDVTIDPPDGDVVDLADVPELRASFLGL